MVLTTYIPCLIPYHNTIPWPAVLMTAAVLADEPGIRILFCCKYTGYMSLNLKLQFILRLIRYTESLQLFVFALESNQDWCRFDVFTQIIRLQQPNSIHKKFLNRFFFIFFGQVLFSVTQWAEILSLLTWSLSYVIPEVDGIKCHLKPFSCVHFETLKLPLYTGSDKVGH